MEGQRTDYTLDEMCVVLAVSESGYRAWKQGGTPDRTRLTDAQMLALIRAIHDELKGELPSVFRLPSGGFHATRFSAC